MSALWLRVLIVTALAGTVLIAIGALFKATRGNRSLLRRVGTLIPGRSDLGRDRSLCDRLRPRKPLRVHDLVHGRATAIGMAVGFGLLIGGMVGLLAIVPLSIAARAGQKKLLAAGSSSDATAIRPFTGGRLEAGLVQSRLSMAADLLAACMEAGAGPGEAAEAVGRSLDSAIGTQLLRVAAELRLGGDPAQCWARLQWDPSLAALGRCMERACRSGAPPARPMATLAQTCRADSARAMQAKARRAGVLATLPLGLCFLPAFLFVAVVPLVIGLAGTLLRAA